MGLQAKNGTVCFAGGKMDYVRFGDGKNILLMLPGLGDGLWSVKGTALAVAAQYRLFRKDYTVYMFSRRQSLSAGTTTRDMARDQIAAMDALGIAQADIVGVSMGGMIAQWMAIDAPGRVGKLVLVVTCAEPNPILTEAVTDWIDCAKRGDHTALMDSNIRRIYSDSYYRSHKHLIPVMGKLTKPKSYDRFFVQAEACLTHNAADFLPNVEAPTLVLGGKNDQALGGEASIALSAAIPNADLRMYEELGHGLYDEAKDFQKVVLDFLLKQAADSEEMA